MSCCHLSQFRAVFAAKLSQSNNFDEAFGKAIWMAYNEGLLAGLKDTREDKSRAVQDVSKVLERGYQS